MNTSMIKEKTLKALEVGDYDEVIKLNEPLVLDASRLYLGSTLVDYDDVYQEGLIGLYKAALNFDPNKGYSFYSYAIICIRNEIRMFIRRSRHLGHEFSMERFTTYDDETNAPVSILDSHVDHSSDMDSHMAFFFFNEQFHRILSNSNTKTREILNLRGQGKTQMEIAKYMGVSQAYVSRALKDTHKRLKNVLGTTKY